MAAGTKSSRSVPLKRIRSNPERIPVTFCPNLLIKLSGTPWVAGIGRVFTHRFYQAPRRSTMIWLRLRRAVFFRGYFVGYWLLAMREALLRPRRLLQDRSHLFRQSPNLPYPVLHIRVLFRF